MTLWDITVFWAHFEVMSSPNSQQFWAVLDIHQSLQVTFGKLTDRSQPLLIISVVSPRCFCMASCLNVVLL